MLFDYVALSHCKLRLATKATVFDECRFICFAQNAECSGGKPLSSTVAHVIVRHANRISQSNTHVNNK
jgi:hypothetical protein